MNILAPHTMDSRRQPCSGRLSRWLTGMLCASLLCITTGASAAAPEKLVLLIRENRNEAGDMVPLRTEIRSLLAYLEKQAHIHFEIHRYPYSRLKEKAMNGEGIVFGLSKTKGYAGFTFSDSIYANYVWLVVRHDAVFSFNDIADLKGKTVGIIRGTSYTDEFDAQRNKLFLVEEDVNSQIARLQKLKNRRMDVMLFGDFHTRPEEVQNVLDKIVATDGKAYANVSDMHFTVLKKPLLTDELHFAALPAFDEAIKKINLAIQAGKKSGEITRILESGK